MSLFFWTSCKNQEKSPTKSIQEAIQSHLGEKYEKSEKDLFALYHAELANGYIRFLILDGTNQKITYGPTEINGMVTWSNDSTLKVQETPEVITDKNTQQSFSYYIDAQTGKKTTLNQK